MLESIQTANETNVVYLTDEIPITKEQLATKDRKTAVITVTPDIARAWLETMRTNRPLRKHQVGIWAIKIQRDMWDETGESIKFDWDGNLMDGQHRLNAVIEAGKAVKMDVDFGLDPKIFDSLDTGLVRNNRDALSLAGEKNTFFVSSALNIVMVIEAGILLRHTRVSPDNSSKLEALDIHPGIRNSIGIGRKVHHILFGAAASALHYLFSQKNQESADYFFDKLFDGTEMEKTDPILMLRNKLQKDGGGARDKRDLKIAWTILAWNAMRLNDKDTDTPKKLFKYEEGNAYPKIV